MWEAKPGRNQSLMEQVCRREWEARFDCWNRNETPIFQQRIYDHSHRFEIDRFFSGQRKLLLRSELQKHGFPKDLPRRCLEVAFDAALSANQKRAYEAAIPDWEEGDRLAENARKALDAFLSWMSAPDRQAWRGRNKDRAEKTKSLTRHIVHATFPTETPFSERVVAAPIVANSLLDAREFLSRAPAEYRRHRDSLVSDNLGEIEKMAFVEHLAEGWLYLCGKVHGVADGTFRSFVDTAWEDIGGKALDPRDNESFSHAIRVASQKLKARSLPDDWRPGWLW